MIIHDQLHYVTSGIKNQHYFPSIYSNFILDKIMTHLISHFYKPNVKANVKSNYYDVQLTVLGQLKDLNSGSTRHQRC